MANPTPPDPPLADQAARNRFTTELDRNFSVTAPAGVGKTTAIVDRVVQLAQYEQQHRANILQRLVVVTYTRKAADEMRTRTAAALHKAAVGPGVINQFHQAFYGTLHSFCLELLRQFGPLAGLTTSFEQVQDDERLWWEFLRGQDALLDFLPAHCRDDFARYGALAKIHQLVNSFGPQIPEPPAPGPAPSVDVREILAFKPTDKRIINSVQQAQQIARQWLEGLEAGAPSPPPDFDKGGKKFQEVWNAVWFPLKLWLGEAYLYLAAAIARDFRSFRVQRGQVNYDDMVALAEQLLQHPAVGPAIRDEERIVILDEAQDTDRLQFAVLLNVAGGQWRPDEPFAAAQGPAPGRYCQVGDPQQAIYSSRADLATYREIHEGLMALNAAEALEFTVTMRCDQSIVTAVNQFYPNILRRPGEPGQQAAFVPLVARPKAGAGSVDRLTLEPDQQFYDEEKSGADDRAEAAARVLARWIRQTGCEGIGATDWSQVALLAPRNAWIETLAFALERERLPVQSHSRKESRASDPVWAWTAALLRVLTQPEDAFETAGVLREVFALPDDAIARYAKAKSAAAPHGVHGLTLSSDIRDESPVAEALYLLQRLRADLQELALSDAFRLILQRVQLAERLGALPELDPDHIEIALKRLMANALSVEEKGLHLADWSRQLLLDIEDNQEADAPKPGHIQLLSCHKSKGLQWQVVILPFIHREVTLQNQHYPRFYRASAGEPAAVAYDAQCNDALGANKRELDAQEFARLAYVTWTRARWRLILVDDAPFFQGARGKGGVPWVGHWRVAQNGPNAQAWVNLPEFQLGAFKLKGGKAREAEPALADPSPALFHAVQRVSPAQRQAPQAFPQRILPSSLAHHAAMADEETPAATGHARDERDWRAEPGYEETRAGAEALGGADYGNWWHGAMEHGPWGASMSTWSDYFQTVLPHCPIPERGPQELEALLATADFAWLNAPARRVRAEAALFWPESAQAAEQPELDLSFPLGAPAAFAYDGFIDLLAHDEQRNRWRVVDWKTDRIGPDPAAELRQTYGPQIAAYVTALRAMFGRPVEGYLYSTRAAQWIRLPG